jgi:Zn-dependent protease
MTLTLSRTSSLMSFLTLIETQFGALPTGDDETTAFLMLQKRIEATELGHCDPATLVEVAMTLGRIESLAERHVAEDHALRGAIILAHQTLIEMVRTC